MKKLHIIHSKSLGDINTYNKGKILPILEQETLDWAEDFHKDAHKATLDIKKELEEKGNIHNKYFKYLRRLLELKYEAYEKLREKDEELPPLQIGDELQQLMQVESLRVPTHISCTQIGMYEFCPRKWYYRYALGIKTPKTSALHFGVAVDEALNFYFEEKIKREAPPISAVYAQFHEHFDKDADKVNWGDDNPKLLRKKGPLVLKLYLEEFDSVTKAIDVQTEVRVHLDNGGILLGYIDILEEKGVVDTKTSKTFWKTTGMYAKQKTELQPKAYGLWFLEEYEKMPEFRYQIVTKEDPPRTQLVSVEVKKFELDAFRRRVQKLWDEINKKLKYGKRAFPAQAEVGNEVGRGPGKLQVGYLCTKEWCDYWKYCEDDGLKVPERWVKRDGSKSGYHVYKDENGKEYKG